MLDSPQISNLLWVSDFADGERKIFIHKTLILMPFHVLHDLRLIRVQWLGVNRETLSQEAKRTQQMHELRQVRLEHTRGEKQLSLTSVKQSLGQEAKEIKWCSRDILFNLFLFWKMFLAIFILCIQCECRNQIIKNFILILIGITYFSVINYIFTRFYHIYH